MLPGALSDPTPRGPSSSSQRYSLSAISLTHYSSMAAVSDLHNALAITQTESTSLMPHDATNN